MNIKLNLGEVITVQVDKVENYGVVISYKGQLGIIKEVDIAWDSRGIKKKMHEMFEIGQSLKVSVNGVGELRFSASLKDMNPNDNPWKDSSLFKAGTIHNAIADKVMGFGVFVKLVGSNVTAFIKSGYENISEGDRLTVEVVEIDKSLKKINVKIVNKKIT